MRFMLPKKLPDGGKKLLSDWMNHRLLFTTTTSRLIQSSIKDLQMLLLEKRKKPQNVIINWRLSVRSISLIRCLMITLRYRFRNLRCSLVIYSFVIQSIASIWWHLAQSDLGIMRKPAPDWMRCLRFKGIIREPSSIWDILRELVFNPPNQKSNWKFPGFQNIGNKKQSNIVSLSGRILIRYCSF